MFLDRLVPDDAQTIPIMGARSRLRLGKHQVSVAALSKVLSAELGLNEAFCVSIEQAASLHDVGKLYVSALINDKSGPHDECEIQAMQQHPLYGYAHLCSFRPTPLTRLAASIAFQHHEHWNGTGYPFALSGDRISIESRIVSICDVYDALREDRPYRTAIGHEAAMDVLTCGDDRTTPSMFDPGILNAMEKCQERIRAVFESHHRAS